ncbi:sulfatase family protein [Gloeobacter violaceus]|uniref:Gll3431 protein n=1 Tax=Gloeobacter violaceus (strain ATCC 29082 / PCC 7421) TaxID=251221 RepID=Q7NFU3_GLOVI|nr:sulfatase [Gloeobacter violaceus]BAC91372.1 gll3431 [Gloeobacter violaceus PCC 7421]
MKKIAPLPVKLGTLALVGLVLAAALLPTPGGFARRGQAAAAVKPSIVVVTADDLSTMELNDGLERGLLPAIQNRLVEEGTVFANSFVSYSLCCPSRSTFLTGQYSHNHGVQGNGPPIGGAVALRDDSTLATWLDDAGYVTGFLGKYLNGYGANKDKSSPRDDATYVPPGWDVWQGLVDPTTYQVYNFKINENGRVANYGTDQAEPPEEYQTDVLSARAVNFVEQYGSGDAPFFLWVNPIAPHFELRGTRRCTVNPRPQNSIRPAPRHAGSAAAVPLPRGPAFNEQDVSDKPTWVQQNPAMSERTIDCLQNLYRNRLEAMRAVDDLVAALFDALERTGALGDTIVLLTSDNGYLLGQHRLTAKVLPYEESIRVPLLVRVPDAGAPGRVDELVINNDLAPTIAAWAGVTPDLAVDGRSLVPLLADSTPAQWRKRLLVGHIGTTNANEPSNHAVLRTGARDSARPNRAYVEYTAHSPELYDLNSDPAQLTSLHAQRPEEVGALSAQLAGLKTCAGSTCRTLEDQ